MASLKSIVRREEKVIRDGIAWVIVYKDGKSWESLELWSDLWNGVWEDYEREIAAEILKVDQNAIAVNGYCCGRLGESVRELEMGISWHYGEGRNLLREYVSDISVFSE